MNMTEKTRKSIIDEYLRGGISYGALGIKYGVSAQAIWMMLKKYKSSTGGLELLSEVKSNLANEYRHELERSQMHVRLLSEMIEIAERELGVSIRKKYGAKQS
jgi:transposase-like protein